MVEVQAIVDALAARFVLTCSSCVYFCTLVGVKHARAFVYGSVFGFVQLENYEEHAEFKELKERSSAMHAQDTGAGFHDISSSGLDLPDMMAMREYYILALYHVVMVMLTIDMMYRPENSLERLFTVSFGGIGTVRAAWAPGPGRASEAALAEARKAQDQL